MADVSNIRCLFNDETLRAKVALLDRLTGLGFQKASYHCDGEHVWICPDYVSENGALRLVEAMEQRGLKASDMSIAGMREYTGQAVSDGLNRNMVIHRPLRLKT